MTDIHCHILPGVDDGADSLQEALAMARMAWESGVRRIIATPHCNLPLEEGNYRSGVMTRRFNALNKAVREAGIGVEILPGAEVFATPEVPQLLREKKLYTLAGSRYLLMEFFFDEDPDTMDAILQEVAQQGYVPVIAHPERYDAVQRAPHMAARWFGSDYVIQLNKGSILGRLGRRAESTADWILGRGLAHIVASDAHSSAVRTPHMTERRRYLTDRCDGVYADILLKRNPGRIAQDLPLLRSDGPDEYEVR